MWIAVDAVVERRQQGNRWSGNEQGPLSGAPRRRATAMQLTLKHLKPQHSPLINSQRLLFCDYRGPRALTLLIPPHCTQSDIIMAGRFVRASKYREFDDSFS